MYCILFQSPILVKRIILNTSIYAQKKKRRLHHIPVTIYAEAELQKISKERLQKLKSLLYSVLTIADHQLPETNPKHIWTIERQNFRCRNDRSLFNSAYTDHSELTPTHQPLLLCLDKHLDLPIESKTRVVTTHSSDYCLLDRYRHLCFTS